MAAIAEEAGVALKTVYLAFETKSGVLRALWHLRLRGDEDDVPVGERDWYREVLDEPDPERQLRLNARNSRPSRSARRACIGVIRGAAPADPDVGALWDRIQSDFYENQRAIVERCARARRSRRASTSTAAPTSCGRSTTPTSGSCWSASAAGRPSEWERWFADTRRRAAAAPVTDWSPRPVRLPCAGDGAALAGIHPRERPAQGIERCPAEAEVARSNRAGERF